jgi:hypothetical protein
MGGGRKAKYQYFPISSSVRKRWATPKQNYQTCFAKVA